VVAPLRRDTFNDDWGFHRRALIALAIARHELFFSGRSAASAAAFGAILSRVLLLALADL
jgi:hypothetical protein